MNTGDIAQLKRKARRLFQNNQINDARHLYQELCQQYPDHESLYNLGLIYGMMGNYEQAEELLQQSISLKPDSDVSWNNLAIMQLSQEKNQEALNSLNKSLQLNPNNTHALNTMGNLYQQYGNYSQAEASFNKAYSVDAKNPLTLNNLGNMHLNRSEYNKAIGYYMRALKGNHQYYDALYNLGSAYHSMGNYEDAIKYYKRANKINQLDNRPMSAIASAYENQGRYKEAHEILAPLIEQGSREPNVILQYAKACLNTQDSKQGIKLVIECLEKFKPSPIDEEELRFVLGDLYNKEGEYNPAFEQYDRANHIRSYSYNRLTIESYFESIKKVFKKEGASRRPVSKINHKPRPVFIIGMPRSGTTLIEQIISSHSDAHGAGELPYVAKIARTMSKDTIPPEPYPDFITNITGEFLDKYASIYLGKIKNLSPASTVITDKMPHNFIYVGLIKMLLPECKIIHCLRDPLDVCLSIYFHNFNMNHPYSDNLSNLGHYYNLYRDMMDYWHHYDNNILDIRYESVIESPKEQVHKILSHIDLEYQDSCMLFYENPRTISTPSYNQVRQPLYKSSMKRWHNYSNHIAELRNSIKDEYIAN